MDARSPGGAARWSAAVLVTGTVAALVAASGLRPVTRRFPAAVVGSVPSFVATELPRAGAAVAGAAALVAARHGAAHRGTGRVGLAATAVAVAVLVELDRRARAVGKVLDAALAQGLPGRPVSPTRPRARSAWGARRRYTARAGARDVPYGPHGAENTLDVWRRPDLPDDAGAPVLVQIHGGAWSSGRKEGQAHPLMAHLVERGWVCVTVNYRLGPQARWPAQIVDVKRALAWTRAHIGEHGGDASPGRGFLAVTGGSSGAHLAALAALTPGEWQPGFAEADISVDAVVGLYGIYDLTSDDGSGTLDVLLADTMMPGALADDPAPYAEASPTLRVHPDAPPFLVLHGTGDALVLPAQSAGLVARLRAVSRAPVVYAELPHAQHAFDTLPTARTERTVRAVEAFLDAVAVGRTFPRGR